MEPSQYQDRFISWISEYSDQVEDLAKHWKLPADLFVIFMLTDSLQAYQAGRNRELSYEKVN